MNLINPQTLAERLLFTTVRIETDMPGLTCSGTGFFYTIAAGDKGAIPLIVTNKHVIRGAITGRITVHKAIGLGSQTKPASESLPVTLQNMAARWIMHPDPTVDLCAMPLGPLETQAEEQGIRLYYPALDQGLIKTDTELSDLNAVEDILMVGYPNGLWDEKNNLPLIRRGITASHPAIDFNQNSVGVIDAACFPGSSGSPILILNENSGYTNRGGNFHVGTRAILLGVLYAGPQIDAKGNIHIRDVPVANIPVSVTPVMLHLGYYAKAKELLVLSDHIRKIAEKDME